MKLKKIIFTLTVFFVMAAIPAFSSSASLFGDVDNSGDITASDARAALRSSVSLDELKGDAFASADVDVDGRITAADARSILRASVNMESYYERYYKNVREKFDLKDNAYKKIRICCNKHRQPELYEVWNKGEVEYFEKYTYSDSGMIEKIEFPDEKFTEFVKSEDKNGNIILTGINPDKTKSVYTYSPSGMIVKAEGLAGRGRYIRLFDSLGRVISCENAVTKEKESFTYMCDTDLIRTHIKADGSYVKNDYNIDGKLQIAEFYSKDGVLTGTEKVTRTTGNIDILNFFSPSGEMDEQKIRTLTYDVNNNLIAEVMSELIEAPDGYDKYLVYEYRWEPGT